MRTEKEIRKVINIFESLKIEDFEIVPESIIELNKTCQMNIDILEWVLGKDFNERT